MTEMNFLVTKTLSLVMVDWEAAQLASYAESLSSAPETLQSNSMMKSKTHELAEERAVSNLPSGFYPDSSHLLETMTGWLR